ncbi:hypothetical protein [Singulisphaera sp. PoT]|uniref:hypothetical protein n=1 Tax=Singulisphaera sp. PoT TaxID=3411797 RepID=UPI003BF4D259
MSEPSTPVARSTTPESPVPQVDVAGTPVPPPSPMDGKVHDHTSGLSSDLVGDEALDRRLAEIEMIGEEAALGWKPQPHQPLSPEVRYLHISRTINQLITDRNRSVGIFLGMASILFAASTALMNVRPDVAPIIHLELIQYWCLPITFGTLAVIGAFMCLILVRTRIGLIYEVAKINTLMGVPSERVKRVNPLSIFFLMYLMVSLLGASCAGLTLGLVAGRVRFHSTAELIKSGAKAALAPDPTSRPILQGVILAVVYLVLFLGMYYGLILRATSEKKLEDSKK